MKQLLAVVSVLAGISGLNAFAQENQNAAPGGASIRDTGRSQDNMSDSSSPGIHAGENRATTQQEQDNIKDTIRPAWKAHSLMSRTYLQAAHDFMDGLDKQADKDAGNLTSPQMRDHVRLYSRESLDNLQRARQHLTELSNSLSRNKNALQSNERRESLAAAQRDIAAAIRQDQALLKRLSDANFLKNKEAMKKQISQVRDTINDAMSNQKDLFGGASVGEM